jgi:probable HAF family extracellular repeat protein
MLDAGQWDDDFSAGNWSRWKENKTLEGNIMSRNRHFPLIALLLFAASGLLPVSSQAQLPAKRSSPFGGNHDTHPSPASPTIASSGMAHTPSGITFAVGLVDFPRSPDSTAQGLNSRGDIVGLYGPNLPAYEGTEQSYVLEGNTFQELVYPGAPYTLGLGINRNRKIVGWYADSNGNAHAFLRTGKDYSNIDHPGSDNTIASNINNTGVIIGTYYQNASGIIHGFVLKKGVYVTIDPDGSTFTEPVGINSNGAIVGFWIDQNQLSHGFVYQDNEFTTIDYPGADNTLLSGINDQGQMVGDYGDDIIVGQHDWPTPNAFFLDHGTFTLIQLPVSDAQVTWTNTFVANEFVGMYVDSLGHIHGYEATISQ